jgi:hypothetical protein
LVIGKAERSDIRNLSSGAFIFAARIPSLAGCRVAAIVKSAVFVKPPDAIAAWRDRVEIGMRKTAIL